VTGVFIRKTQALSANKRSRRRWIRKSHPFTFSHHRHFQGFVFKGVTHHVRIKRS